MNRQRMSHKRSLRAKRRRRVKFLRSRSQWDEPQIALVYPQKFIPLTDPIDRDQAPDVMGRVSGYKLFRLVPPHGPEWAEISAFGEANATRIMIAEGRHHPRLSSPNMGSMFEPDQGAATCHSGQDHPSPSIACGCGYYAMWGPLTPIDMPHYVICRVSGWGWVIEAQFGWRSEYMRVEEIFAAPHSWDEGALDVGDPIIVQLGEDYHARVTPIGTTPPRFSPPEAGDE